MIEKINANQSRMVKKMPSEFFQFQYPQNDFEVLHPRKNPTG
jgi:hypothetical protein